MRRVEVGYAPTRGKQDGAVNAPSSPRWMKSSPNFTVYAGIYLLNNDCSSYVLEAVRVARSTIEYPNSE